MGKINQGYDLANDPFATTTDEISEYYHVQSTGWGGNNLAVIVPSGNFPVNTQNRVFVQLPMIINRSDLDGSRPIKIIDTTLGTTMTRVTTAPTGNNYRIPPESSIRRDIIEVSSTKIGFVLDYDFYGEGTVFNADEFNTFREFLVDITTKSTNYTITNTDGFRRIIANPNSTSQYGLLTITLPPGTTSVLNRNISIIHSTMSGLVKISSTASNINNKGNLLPNYYLFHNGSQAEFVWNGVYWVNKDTSIVDIGWQNRSDWTNVHIGNGFSYDTKSTFVDFTGMVGTSTNGNTFVCLFDTGGSTSLSGILYYYEVVGNTSNIGIFLNNGTITMGSGQNCLVNEVSGSNKNIDYNLYHGINLNLNSIKHTFMYSTSSTGASYTNSMDLSYNGILENAANFTGFQIIQISTDILKIQTGAHGGGSFFDDTGSAIAITTQDSYVNQILTF